MVCEIIIILSELRLQQGYLNKSILYFIDENEVYNNPNFHSEEQDEFEIPNGKSFFYYYIFRII